MILNLVKHFLDINTENLRFWTAWHETKLFFSLCQMVFSVTYQTLCTLYKHKLSFVLHRETFLEYQVFCLKLIKLT